MSGGVATIHRDSSPLFTGTHAGADGASVLLSHGAMFATFGAKSSIGNYVYNATKEIGGALTASTDDTVTATGVTWDNGDTYEIYKTATKDSVISRDWTDVSAGFRADPRQLIDGWLPEDRDLDDAGKYKVFGEGQPE